MGRFCPSCGSPQHHRCDKLDQTPPAANRCSDCQCNLDNPFAAQFRDEMRRLAEVRARRIANLILIAALLLQLIVVGNIAVGIWVTPANFRWGAALEKLGFKPADALHVAAAEAASADVLLSCDDRFCRAGVRHRERLRIAVRNPLDWLKEVEDAADAW
jgi:hypothetical protein